MRIVFLAIICSLFILGCSKRPQHFNSVTEQIIGEWTRKLDDNQGGMMPESITLAFKENNILEQIAEGHGNSPFRQNGTWEIIGDSLFTNIELIGKHSNIFKIKVDTLFVFGKLKDGSDYTYRYVRE